MKTDKNGANPRSMLRRKLMIGAAAMALSLAVYVVAALVMVPWLGNHGLWLALLISFVARGVTLWLRYPALEASVTPAAKDSAVAAH